MLLITYLVYTFLLGLTPGLFPGSCPAFCQMSNEARVWEHSYFHKCSTLILEERRRFLCTPSSPHCDRLFTLTAKSKCCCISSGASEASLGPMNSPPSDNKFPSAALPNFSFLSSCNRSEINCRLHKGLVCNDRNHFLLTVQH